MSFDPIGEIDEINRKIEAHYRRIKVGKEKVSGLFGEIEEDKYVGFYVIPFKEDAVAIVPREKGYCSDGRIYSRRNYSEFHRLFLSYREKIDEIIKEVTGGKDVRKIVISEVENMKRVERIALKYHEVVKRKKMKKYVAKAGVLPMALSSTAVYSLTMLPPGPYVDIAGVLSLVTFLLGTVNVLYYFFYEELGADLDCAELSIKLEALSALKDAGLLERDYTGLYDML